MFTFLDKGVTNVRKEDKTINLLFYRHNNDNRFFWLYYQITLVNILIDYAFSQGL
jgi:hypothetical protein